MRNLLPLLPSYTSPNHDDPILAQAVSEGRRLEHAHEEAQDIPDPESRDTFLSSKLKWRERDEPDHQTMLNWYRDLIRLRQTTPCLLDGDMSQLKVSFDEKSDWLVMDRGPMKLLFNFSDDESAFDVPENSEVVLASEPVISHEAGKFILAPSSFVAVRAE